MREDNVLISLVSILVPLSLGAIGGASSIYAPLQHQVVSVHGWLTASDFLDLFAVSRVMPGPGSFIATLIGWRMNGWLGAIIATLSIFLPSSALCLIVAGMWERSLGPSWRKSVEKGLMPIGAGLMFAGVYGVMRLSSGGVFAWILMIIGAASLALRPKFHPLWMLAAGAAASLLWSYAGALLHVGA